MKWPSRAPIMFDAAPNRSDTVNDEAGQADGEDLERPAVAATPVAATPPATPPEPAAGGSDGARRGCRSLALAGVVAIVALVPVLAGLLIGPGSAATPARTPGYTPVTAGGQRLHPLPARAGDGIPAGPGALVALVRHATTMRSAPAGAELSKLGTKTEFGSPQALWVVSHVPGWLGVISPLAGNGHVGWIPQSATELGRVDWELKVSLSARRLTVLSGGRLLARYTVAIGSPAAPTPTGRFAVTDRLNTGDPSGPYGCCILALSARLPARDPGLDRRQPDRDPLDPGHREHRRARQPRLRAGDARRRTLAAGPRSAGYADADQHLTALERDARLRQRPGANACGDRSRRRA